jgi:hypothetical protein
MNPFRCARILGLLAATMAVGLASSQAWAGTLFINGVKADGLRSQEFKGVNMKVDASGNIYVDAPNYTVQVVESAPETPPAQLDGAAAPVGKYWLITEDNQSTGNTLEVTVNGTLVRRVKSGDAQLILDLAPYLKIGDNQVTVTAVPGAAAEGGPMHVYIGTGSNDGGVIKMNNPAIHFARKPGDPAAGTTKQYTLLVQ